AIERQTLEVLAPEPWHLGVPVDRAAADRRREAVHITDERAVDTLAGFVLTARRARLEMHVLVLEEAARFDLVVAERDRPDTGVRAESGQQVAALLEDHDGMTGATQLPCGDAATGARSHDDDRCVAHRRLSHHRSRGGGPAASAGRNVCKASVACARVGGDAPPDVGSGSDTCASV